MATDSASGEDSVRPSSEPSTGPSAGLSVRLPADRLGSGRLGLLSALLGDAVRSVSAPGRRARLLDCGGGTGTFAVPLASTGAEVTVLDISADALATLRRRAQEAGVADRIHAVQGDVEAMSDPSGAAIEPGGYDLVLAHGILEAVDDLDSAVRAICAAVRPGGLLSVLVANPPSAVLARALAGDPVGALRELRGLDSARRVGPDLVERLCVAAGFAIEARHGVGVFSDLVPGSTLERAESREALAELDAEAASLAPFADLAGRVHLRARRPAG